MKKILLIIIPILAILTIKTGTAQDTGKLKYSKEIEPYVEFLKSQSQTPIDYLFNLFEKYDIVNLGERNHKDTTQYGLILKLIGDKRFIENVGNVFLEVGSVKKSEQINALLKQNIPDSTFRKELILIYRDFVFAPLWDKYNHYQLMTGIFEINKELTDEQKINVWLTDVAFSWEGMTEEKYKDFIATMSVNKGMGRDSMMAFNFIKQFDKILNSKEKRKKGLIIYNGPHSYGKFDCYGNGEYNDCAGKYIMERYPNKVANVMINFTKFRAYSTPIKPVVEGKWDAAFRVAGNPEVAFDFNNSPFGNDFFDHPGEIDMLCTNARYKDVYTGFLFYLPIEKWLCVVGTPNLVDDAFTAELIRRHKVIGKNLPEEGLAEGLMDYYNTVRSFPCQKMDEMEKYISKWLE